jgi:hypothetical protein
LRASSNQFFPEDGNSLPGKQAVQKGSRCVMLWHTKRKRKRKYGARIIFLLTVTRLFFFSN